MKSDGVSELMLPELVVAGAELEPVALFVEDGATSGVMPAVLNGEMVMIAPKFGRR
jgi:hypothetical protein